MRRKVEAIAKLFLKMNIDLNDESTSISKLEHAKSEVTALLELSLSEIHEEILEQMNLT